MVNTPLLSIAIPLYNKEQYLRACLSSIFEAAHNCDWVEVLIVNDGSTDGSMQIVAQFEADRRLRVVTQKNGGVSKARNTALREVRGDFIWFVDADDMVAPGALKVIKADLDRWAADTELFAYPMVLKNADLSGDERVLMTYMHPQRHRIEGHANVKRRFPSVTQAPWLVNLDIQVGMRVIARSLFDRSGLDFPPGLIYEDLATLPRLTMAARGIRVSRKPLCWYFNRVGSIMNTPDLRQNLDIIPVAKMLTQYALDFDDPRVYLEAEFLAVVHLMAATYRRVYEIDRRAPELPVLRDTLRTLYPKWRENPLVRALTWKRRALLEANALGLGFINRFVG
ncbi:glycosyltransferase family 2 protein [Gleimia hominis]|uniref:glycosyltransferase family 2 protein n=1 Tax=Gleimia hominis TaxID=595468 RepID=UPI000C8089A6|nr:glycosyltransferase [Gleimia hominis]WIK64654.1 glycosyltransferase [Gleimia hominis]